MNCKMILGENHKLDYVWFCDYCHHEFPDTPATLKFERCPACYHDIQDWCEDGDEEE